MRRTDGMRMWAALVVVLIAGCADAPDDPGPYQHDCGATDPRVGTKASLAEHAHGVTGTVKVVDDCTLEIAGFTFDGGGIDVRAIGAADGDFANGAILTSDLRAGGARDGDTLRIPLPVGVTLDDVAQFSIWCVPAGANLADARLFD